MFSKILIANRGEIACRIIRTARRMGIQTVAVYSTADKDALHVLQADEAIEIGPPPAAESYLSIDRIVAAAQQTGADAVHPGYGLLSERAEFAQRLADVGIAFIGPPPSAIAKMGDKITSKRLAQQAGVNTIPGYTDAIHNAEHAVEIAREIGYPVMLKATAGGGGKGMRIADNDQECREGFERAANEARSSFGDERLFLEKYIAEPRHIEIQVLADQHGGAIYLGERECSLQRRHQKVIEEAPAPGIDNALRSAMGQQAVALAHAVGYCSAGTVEFIVDANHHFYFLEMNTRLQVEHPVTEFITGLDLVEQMIRIAAGERLSLSQEQVQLKGWSIEARVYAEDPFRNFLPSAGRLVRYQPPAESKHVRVDTGVYEGDEITVYYDPMIAKLITYGANRDEACAHMRHALNQFYIRGVENNLSFLGAMIKHSRFAAGQLHTNLIAQEYPTGFHAGDVVHDEPKLIVAVAATIHRRYMDRAARITGQLPGYERKVHDDWVVVWEGQRHDVKVRPCEQEGHEVLYRDHRLHVVSDWQFGQPLFRGTIDEREICIQVERRNMVYRLFHWGAQIDVRVLTRRAAELRDCMPPKKPLPPSRHVRSPMPGLLSQLNVEAGTAVKAGDLLAVIEAMKMENVLRSDRDAVVAQVLTQVGETLTVDQPILEFE